MFVIDKGLHHQLLTVALADIKPVDFSINCVLENTMLDVFADSHVDPQALMIKNGIFRIFAGDVAKFDTQSLIQQLPKGTIVLPSSESSVEHLLNMSMFHLEPATRFSFSDQPRLQTLKSIYRPNLIGVDIYKVDMDVAVSLNNNPDFSYHLQNFSDPTEFVLRGLGYVALSEQKIIGCASSALMCEQGIEVNVKVLSEYRRQGIAKLLASKLVTAVAATNKLANWDAGNLASKKLAESIGYQGCEAYTAYQVTSAIN